MSKFVAGNYCAELCATFKFIFYCDTKGEDGVYKKEEYQYINDCGAGWHGGPCATNDITLTKYDDGHYDIFGRETNGGPGWNVTFNSATGDLKVPATADDLVRQVTGAPDQEIHAEWVTQNPPGCPFYHTGRAKVIDFTYVDPTRPNHS